MRFLKFTHLRSIAGHSLFSTFVNVCEIDI